MRSADVRSQAMPPSRSEFEDSRGSNCVESSAAGEGDVLRAARNALERRSWQEAFGLYADADGVAPLEPAELLELAEAALWSSNADACVDARERAYAAFVQQAQPIAAARVALDLAADYFRKNSLASAAGALIGLCYSRREKSSSWLRSTGWLQVRQRPAQQRRTGCRSSTACGSVRPAAGLLGRAVRG